MTCPECKSKKCEIVDHKWSESGELYEVGVHECLDCGCVFDEEEI